MDLIIPYDMSKRTVSITLERYEELAMLLNKNRIQEAKILELLEEIRKLKKNNEENN